jgi:hypothetical protein
MRTRVGVTVRVIATKLITRSRVNPIITIIYTYIYISFCRNGWYFHMVWFRSGRRDHHHLSYCTLAPQRTVHFLLGTTIRRYQQFICGPAWGELMEAVPTSARWNSDCGFLNYDFSVWFQFQFQFHHRHHHHHFQLLMANHIPKIL